MPRTRRRIWLPEPEEWAAELRDKYVDERHFTSVIGRWSTDVYREDGRLLLRYIRRALPPDVCGQGRGAFRAAGSAYSDIRGFHGSIAGYFTKPAPGPTEFTRKRPDKWLRMLPLLRELSVVFRRELPGRYLIQRRLTKAVPGCRIADTAFTTVTVNRWDATHDARSSVHRDANNLHNGFGCMTVLRRGQYTGGYLIFPRYRVKPRPASPVLSACHVPPSTACSARPHRLPVKGRQPIADDVNQPLSGAAFPCAFTPQLQASYIPVALAKHVQQT